jgi:hypothetical protein
MNLSLEKYSKENYMLPIVDYGGIAIVIPKVTAVGNIIEDNGKFGLEIYLSGMNEPLIIGFDNSKEARESRDELIAIIAQFYYAQELGQDFDLEEIGDDEDADTDEGEEEERH